MFQDLNVLNLIREIFTLNKYFLPTPEVIAYSILTVVNIDYYIGNYDLPSFITRLPNVLYLGAMRQLKCGDSRVFVKLLNYSL